MSMFVLILICMMDSYSSSRGVLHSMCKIVFLNMFYITSLYFF